MPLEVNPDDTEARIRLGYFLGAPQQMLVPDLSASKRQFEKVLALQPNTLEAMLPTRFSPNSDSERQTKPLNGLKISSKITGVIPGRTTIWGSITSGTAPPKKPLRISKNRLRLKPRDPETLWNLWTAYSKLGGYPEDLPEAFKIQPWEGFVTPNSVGQNSLFIDVASDLRMDKVDGGRGSAWGDYDNDGDLDIVAVGHVSTPRTFPQ